MSRAERNALRAMADVAAPRPWHVQGAVVYSGDWGSIESDMMIYDEGGHTESDARYIAAACNAVPALLDALDAAEAALDRVREVAAGGLTGRTAAQFVFDIRDAIEGES